MVNFLVRMSFLTARARTSRCSRCTRVALALREAPRRGPRRTSSSRSSRSCWRRRRRRAATPPTPCARVWRCSTWRSTPTLSASSPGTRRSSRRCSSRASTRAPGRRTRRSPTRRARHVPAAAPGRGARRARGVPPPRLVLLQHRLDDVPVPSTSPPLVAVAAGAAATPNAQTRHERGVRAEVPTPRDRNRRVVDRYLPHLVKLLSRLTHELNQASAAGAAPPPRAAASRARRLTPPAPERLRRADSRSRCVSRGFRSVIPSGGEHKQLVLRMLLQLINCPNTHGAALMATLDAVKGWADDAVAGASIRAPSASARGDRPAGDRRGGQARDPGVRGAGRRRSGRGRGATPGGGREGRGHGRGEGGG